MEFLNTAGYQFVSIPDTPVLRQKLLKLCNSLELKGTILLGEEGINIFLSGPINAIESFRENLAKDKRFSNISWKDSFSAEISFNRMLVKIKREIIPMGRSDINPAIDSAPFIDPFKLAGWLDEGRKVILLDTRNAFEVELGTFKEAIHLNLHCFREFANAAQSLSNHFKSLPVVTFCTGGIRCEKAAPLLQHMGFDEVYQLEGGILNYFEKIGNRHYKGDCFVFDRRVALTSNLVPGDFKQCFNCQKILTPMDQQLPSYQLNRTCPYCTRPSS